MIYFKGECEKKFYAFRNLYDIKPIGSTSSASYALTRKLSKESEHQPSG